MFPPLISANPRSSAGWVIRHRVVDRRGSASTPEGPGYACSSGYGRGGAPIQAAFRIEPNCHAH